MICEKNVPIKFENTSSTFWINLSTPEESPWPLPTDIQLRNIPMPISFLS